MKRLFVFCLLVLLMVSCGSSKSEPTPEELSSLKALLEERDFEFQALWALPQTTREMAALANAGLLRNGDTPNRINLVGNPNYLRMTGDSVDVNLPYYGVQRMNVSLDPRKNGFNFHKPYQGFELTYKPEKQLYEVRFEVTDKTNSYWMILTVYPGRTAYLKVNSSNRDFINYEGKISSIKEKNSP
ncbi:DUF4251 domain-containing protein [Robertkochia marina]|uniref:DUF4251 domain-containing protein n=1 Tax=Robertkochia marina TaxID=1227945 RepID=A0A4S3M5I4_9FLAO|nr:DUF4251 domain-containing protein [Robertkochia marina]THD69601.1 DUF4251 domain-containing protein [Robertkochia marina]TRZ47144.1 DUF4251 domain-containing protein [Robertkochia marina]